MKFSSNYNKFIALWTPTLFPGSLLSASFVLNEAEEKREPGNKVGVIFTNVFVVTNNNFMSVSLLACLQERLLLSLADLITMATLLSVTPSIKDAFSASTRGEKRGSFFNPVFCLFVLFSKLSIPTTLSWSSFAPSIIDELMPSFIKPVLKGSKVFSYKDYKW